MQTIADRSEAPIAIRTNLGAIFVYNETDWSWDGRRSSLIKAADIVTCARTAVERD